MTAINTSGIVRISVSGNGVQANNISFDPYLSGDGRFVVFLSYASLAPGASPTYTNVFLRDTLTGTTQLISTDPVGAPANYYTWDPSVSDNGRYVVFNSYATNLAGEMTSTEDVFVRDVWSGTLTMASQGIGGVFGNGDSFNAAITGDGRYVVFESFASNLVAGDFNASPDVFVRDLLTGQTTRVSVSGPGTEGNAGSWQAELSADGRYVVFESAASNLVAGDTNGAADIFLRDLVAGTTRRVSVSTGGVQSDQPSGGGQYNHFGTPRISGDGRYVAFVSSATDLVAGDTNFVQDVFLRDTVANTTTRLSVSSGGAQANGDCPDADISDNGRYVVFHSTANTLVAGDTNGVSDIFLHDTVAHTTTRLSVGLGGVQANGFSDNATISADGRHVTFVSGATNLIGGDVNSLYDVFRVSLFATDAADYLIGSDAADGISALAGADIVNAGLGNDAVNGGTGNDTLDGGAGNDRLDGGAGNDTLRGLAGNDTYVLGSEAAGVDTVAETGGIDTITSTISRSLLSYPAIENLTLTGAANISGTGNGLANTLIGNNAANALKGGAGNDRLFGNAGNDILIGGAGRDVSSGGLGNDTFRFTSWTHSPVGSPDLVTDFDDFGNDRIDVSALFGPAMTYRHNLGFTAAGQVRIADIAGPDLLVQINTGGSLAADFAIRLSATTFGSMTASDFIL